MEITGLVHVMLMSQGVVSMLVFTAQNMPLIKTNVFCRSLWESNFINYLSASGVMHFSYAGGIVGCVSVPLPSTTFISCQFQLNDREFTSLAIVYDVEVIYCCILFTGPL